LLVKRFFFLLNAAFAMAILDLITDIYITHNNSMGQSPSWEANSSSASHELPEVYKNRFITVFKKTSDYCGGMVTSTDIYASMRTYRSIDQGCTNVPKISPQN
jgi:hypothetical protein